MTEWWYMSLIAPGPICLLIYSSLRCTIYCKFYCWQAGQATVCKSAVSKQQLLGRQANLVVQKEQSIRSVGLCIRAIIFGLNVIWPILLAL